MARRSRRFMITGGEAVMARQRFLLGVVFLLLTLYPKAVLASSPTPSLNGLGWVRFAAISFFLMVFISSTLLVWWMWRSLHLWVKVVPRPTLKACLGIEIVLALLLAVPFLMIAPAHPLAAPGALEAWEQHAAYGTEPITDRVPESDPMKERREALKRLRYELWEYALCNKGRFPVALNMLWDREADCTFPASPGMEFCYVPGLNKGDYESILAFEPDVLGEPRLVLHVSGKITEMSSDEIRQAVKKGDAPTRLARLLPSCYCPPSPCRGRYSGLVLRLTSLIAALPNDFAQKPSDRVVGYRGGIACIRRLCGWGFVCASRSASDGVGRERDNQHRCAGFVGA